jgi:uncharacterized protein YdeI (YjbR/CyaY-like superfamily)
MLGNKVRLFRSPAAMAKWLLEHHAAARELWVGFYKVGSGKASITWPESVDAALCVGWIDGVRKNVDACSYKIRFTPRKPKSVWSAINIAKVKLLSEQGRMTPAGLAAFEARRDNRSGIYAYEQHSVELPAPYAQQLRKNRRAWIYWQKRPPSYRKTACWWVVSAKQETTRLKRLQLLTECCASGQAIPQLRPRSGIKT